MVWCPYGLCGYALINIHTAGEANPEVPWVATLFKWRPRKRYKEASTMYPHPTCLNQAVLWWTDIDAMSFGFQMALILMTISRPLNPLCGFCLSDKTNNAYIVNWKGIGSWQSTQLVIEIVINIFNFSITSEIVFHNTRFINLLCT